MREILFRGKTINTGEWVYGYYCPHTFGNFPCKDAIMPKDMLDSGCWTAERIISESIGQYTGLTDKNGEKIFEGDLCLCDRHINDRFDKIVFEIKFDECRGFYGENFNEIEAYEFCMCEIVGNIYDNPELLKGSDGE